MIRYFPPKATAGFATFSVSTPSLLPWPPARSMAIISFLIMQSPLVVVMVTIRQSAVSRGTEQLQVMII